MILFTYKKFKTQKQTKDRHIHTDKRHRHRHRHITRHRQTQRHTTAEGDSLTGSKLLVHETLSY